MLSPTSEGWAELLQFDLNESRHSSWTQHQEAEIGRGSPLRRMSILRRMRRKNSVVGRVVEKYKMLPLQMRARLERWEVSRSDLCFGQRLGKEQVRVSVVA